MNTTFVSPYAAYAAEREKRRTALLGNSAQAWDALADVLDGIRMTETALECRRGARALRDEVER